MTLSPAGFRRLQYLLGKDQVTHHLTAEEKEEVRRLLVSESPAMAKHDWDSLLSYGLILVGVRALVKRLKALD